MSESPIKTSGGLITFTVKVEGSTVPDEISVLSIETEAKVGQISKAYITILDGNPAKQTFKASSSSTFVPGAEVTIEAGYDTKNKLIFKGIITGQSLQINPSGGSTLVVSCHDPAVKMIVGRKSKTYSKQTDSEIISSIIGNYGGLSSDVSSTSMTWPEQVQYYATDWDFILARAEANGMIVTVNNGKITVEKPDAQTDSVLKLTYGNDIFEFHADLDAISQLGEVKASAWDYKTQQVVSGEASNDHAGPGNLSSSTLSEVVGLSDFQLQTSADLEDASLTDWAKAQLVKSEYAKIQGEVKSQGTATVLVGNYITLQGLGDRFNGDHLVSGIQHSISDGNWLTQISIGLSPVWFTEEPDVMAPPASGLLPGYRGLFNAIVKKMYEDPDSQYRILLDMPLFDPDGEGIWARLTNFYSTSGAGAFFLPEVGDEVIVGFLNEDPRFPIILGSVYSSSSLKPFEGLDPDEQNSLKAIVSKSGIYIQFNDEKKILTLTTPGGNKMIFSDEDQQISIQDQNGNSIMMSESGIEIKSPSNITIQADESVSITGNTGVTIEASGGDVSVSGINISHSADAEFSAEGSATASVQGGAELSLSAAMVLINS